MKTFAKIMKSKFSVFGKGYIFLTNFLLGVAGVGAIFVGIFSLTQSPEPHTAELAFTEYSKDTSVVGSIIPASCNSVPPGAHRPGDSCPKVNGACAAVRNTCSAGVLGSPSETTAQWQWLCNGQYGGTTPPLCVQLKPPSLTLTASANPIDPESSATLSWTVANASSCTASGGWSGAKAIAGGSQSVTPAINTLYTISCSGPGGSVTKSVSLLVNPPVVTLTATPTLIGPGNSSTLNWTTKGASSCTASGGWSGAKAIVSGSEIVTPPAPYVTTVYSLSCSGPSGTTNRTATVTLPSGFINATNCTVLLEGKSCPSLVTWQANNFLGTPSVLQGSTQFSTAAANIVGSVRPIHPDDHIFTLKDTGSTFTRTANATTQCAAGGIWVPSITTCATLPVITIAINPNLIRSGDTAPIDITIKSLYPLTCTLLGGAQETFTHTASANTISYRKTTRPLTSAAIVRIECAHASFVGVLGNAETRVSVVPIIEEI